MSRVVISLLFVVVFLGLGLVVVQPVQAQVAVAAYYAPAPAVGYVPVRRGLFGPRIVYRPVVAYPAPVVAVPAVRAVRVAVPRTTYYYGPVTRVVPAPVTVYRQVVPAVVYFP